MPWLGLYVASFLLIAVFMKWLGRYSWTLTLGVAIAVPLIAFVMFEKWFLVPLPKGPIEELLGLLRTIPVPTWASGTAETKAGDAQRLREGYAAMEEIANLFQGFATVLQIVDVKVFGYAVPLPFNVLVMVIGILLGVIIGVLPGLGGANGVAILLPLTFSMPPTSAIIMLSCIYWGALFGGAITSILFNIPGEPWSVATTFDGHPMARGQGRRGADRRVHVVVRRRAVRRHHDHAGCPAGREIRAAIRPGGEIRRVLPRLLQLRRHEQGAAGRKPLPP